MTSARRATPSKRVRGSGLPPPRRRTTEQIGAALALLIVGVIAGVVVVNVIQGAAPAASATATAPGEATDPVETEPIGSDVPEESVVPASSVLEARMPATVNGVTLTVQSAVDATSLSSGPDGRALNAAVVHLGKLASDLEIAIAYDESGSIDLTILGFRVDGITGADMREAVLTAWLSAGTPGVTTATLGWSGTAVTKVSYGDDGADEFVLIVNDSVFVLETADAAVAQSAAAALVSPGSVPASASASPGQ
jgi:hypothetical protein